MSKVNRSRHRLGMTLGFIYHAFAHPVAGLTLLSGNKQAQEFAEWMLTTLGTAAMEMTSKQESSEDCAGQNNSREKVSEFRTEHGEVFVRGFLPYRSGEE
jgi:hypothetical protein